MRDAARQDSQRFHLLRFEELLFHPLLVGNVSKYQHDAENVVVFVADRSRAVSDAFLRSVASHYNDASYLGGEYLPCFQHLASWISKRLPGFSIHSVKNLRQ